MEVMDKPRTELDLVKAIMQGRELVTLHISYIGHRSESVRKLVNVLMERFQNLDGLIAFHRSILELHPPDDPARSSLLRDVATCLWRGFRKKEEPSALEEAIALELEALNLRQFGHANHAESLQTLVDFLCVYSKLGKVTDSGELVTLGHAVLELGPSENPAYALCLRELAKLVATTDVQEDITFTNFALKVCLGNYPDRLALLEAITTYRRKKFKTSAKADRSEVKELIRKAMHETFKTLSTRLLNTLTGRLCGRDDLALNFDNSEEYKKLLSCIADSHPSLVHELIRETVSTYSNPRSSYLSHRNNTGHHKAPIVLCNRYQTWLHVGVGRHMLHRQREQRRVARSDRIHVSMVSTFDSDDRAPCRCFR